MAYSKGRLTQMTDASGATAFAYDIRGRVTQKAQTIDRVWYTTRTTYDAADPASRITGITYPDGAVVAYQYDSDGALWKVSGATVTYAAFTGYNALGQVGTVSFGNGVVTSYGYNDTTNNRLRSVTSAKPGATLLSLTYDGYDSVGNIIHVTNGLNATLTQTFVYDELNRLTSATSMALGSLGYAYDQLGNITVKEGVSYAYDPVKVHAVTTTSDGKSYVYDANGNMLSDSTRSFAWDYDNRPASITVGKLTTAFTYDGTGQRLKKLTKSVATIYAGKLYECTNGSCTRNIYAGDKLVASVDSATGAPRYYHPDHLGSTRLVTDAAAAVLETFTYKPFGETTPATSGRRFTGQLLDAETGLYFYNARYYNAQLGRFVSADSVVQNPCDPQALNRFSYVRNNPVRYQDPTGNIFIIDDMLIGAVVGAIVGGTIAAVTGQDVWRGVAMGAISGAFFGLGSGVIAAASITSTIASAGIYAAAGAGAGAINAKISGSNMERGALYGGALGVAGDLMPVPNIPFFGTSAGASIANRILNAALAGAVFGAAQAGMTGGNVGRGALMGAAAWAAGETLNMAVGHAVGYLASGKGPEFENGVFIYTVPKDGWGAITFGNVITGDATTLASRNIINQEPDPSGRLVKDHEMSHVRQDPILGPSYIPAHAASLLMGGIIGVFTGTGFAYGTHAYNVLERGWTDVPSY